MKNNINQIIEKYRLQFNGYKLSSIEEGEKFHKAIDEKWQHKYGKGWYGFSLSFQTPEIWYRVLDESLEYINEKDPEFEICQIKTKFGGIRMYINTSIKDLNKEIDELEKVLFDNKLIY